MKVEFSLLFKNGSRDNVKLEAPKEEVESIVEGINSSMSDGASCCLRLGDGELNGRFYRMSEVVSVKMTIEETRDANRRIHPKYVSFEEAINAYKGGRMIKCYFPPNENVYSYYKIGGSPDNTMDLYEIINGKWTIEND